VRRGGAALAGIDRRNAVTAKSKGGIVDSRTVGIVLGVLGLVCALVGIFVLDGISIEFPGIILGGLGYYFGLTSSDRTGQVLGIAAVVLNVVSMFISGITAPPQ
jgi:uncharacterized RDD family membrane protein YckC